MLDTFVVNCNHRYSAYQKDIRSYFYFLKDSMPLLKSEKAIALSALEQNSKSENRSTVDVALNQARSVKSYIDGANDELKSRTKSITRYKIEWHRKFTLSIACFLLFLIGAPLGAIIRKGGLGMPIVISIAFFLSYHITSITGEKFAKEGVISAVRGMWQSSLMLLPIGIFFVYKATRDSALFDSDAYINFFKRLIPKRK
jgi:lipopolysaccharide export system permease protein